MTSNELDEWESEWGNAWEEEWEDDWVNIQKTEKPRPPTPPSSIPSPQKPRPTTLPYVKQANSKPYVEKIMDPVGHHFSTVSEMKPYVQIEPMDIPYCYGE